MNIKRCHLGCPSRCTRIQTNRNFLYLNPLSPVSISSACWSSIDKLVHRWLLPHSYVQCRARDDLATDSVRPELSPLYVPVSPAPGAARRKPCHVALITILDYCQPPALARRRPVHDKAVRARAPTLLLMKLLSALVDCTTAIRTLNGGCIPGHGTSYLMLRLRYEHPTWTIFPAKVVRGTTPLSLVILLCWYNADLCGTCV